MQRRGLQKRGAVEADWILSLGIFLLYLSFFFMYMAPLSRQQPDAAHSLLFDVERQLRANATWQVSRIPILLHSNVSSQEPIVISFSLPWNNFSFVDNTSYYTQGDKLAFSASMQPGASIKWLVSSEEAYPQTVPETDFHPTAGGLSIDSERFQATFEGLPLSAEHIDKQRLTDFNISLNGAAIPVETAERNFNFSTAAASYTFSNGVLNHTIFVVKGFPRLFGFATPAAPTLGDNLTLAVTIRNYTSYFVNEGAQGQLNFSSSQCVSASSDYLDFSDGTSGLTFLVKEGALFSLCPGNQSVALSFSIPFAREAEYSIHFHSGTFEETLPYRHALTAVLGIPENVSGLSLSHLERLNRTAYGSLKTAWHYPSSRDFDFTLLNASNQPLLSYAPTASGVVNVFTREFEAVILDKYGTKSTHTLRIRGW